MPTIDIGIRVCFSGAFLRAIGVYTGDMPCAVGTVVSLVPLGECQLAEVAWDTPGELPGRVLTGNLWPVGRPEPA